MSWLQKGMVRLRLAIAVSMASQRRHNLNTGKERLQRLEELLKPVVNISQIEQDRAKSKNRHIEASYPGELVGVDTFPIGCLKGVGRIYQQTACDCFSSFGWAKIYLDKTVDSAIDFLENRLLPQAIWIKTKETPSRPW